MSNGSEELAVTGGNVREEPGENFSEDEVWLTTGQAAKILGASPSTVRRLADQEVLVSRRKKTWGAKSVDSLGRVLQGHRRVSEASVRRALAEHNASPGVVTLDTLDS
jgi:hypothetical protein